MMDKFTPSRIFLFYGHMSSNIGDIAINSGEISLLRKVFPSASLNVVFFGSDTNKYIHQGVTSCDSTIDTIFTFIPSPDKALRYLSNPSAFLKHCGAQDSDLIILASGEHFFSYNNHYNVDGIFWRTLPLLAAKVVGKHVVLLPSTLGPFEANQSCDLMCSALQLVDDFAIRDALSKQYVKPMDCLGDPPLLLDPAFFTEPIDLDTTSINDSEENPVADGHLAIVMRFEEWGIRLSKEQLKSKRSHHEYSDTIAFKFTKDLCDCYLAQTEHNIVCYVQSIADEKLAQCILHEYSGGANGDRIRLYRPNTIGEYLKNLSQSGFIVASRFHAIILSLTIRKPVYGVYFETHGHKMPGLFELIDAQDCCDAITMESYDSVVEKILDMILNKIEGQEFVQGRIDMLRQSTLNWLSGIEPNTYDPANLLKFWTLLGEYSVEHFSGLLTETGRKKEIEHTLRIAREQKKAEELRQSTAYQIGKQILKDTKRPLHWPFLPFKLLRLSPRVLLLIEKLLRLFPWPPFFFRLLRLFLKHTGVSNKSAQNQLTILKHLDIKYTNEIEPIAGRICYVLHNSLPYASGGYAVRSHGLALGLMENGFEVLAVTRPGFPHDTINIDFADVTDSDIDGVKYCRIAFPARTGSPTATYMNSIIARFEERFRDIRPSIVIAASFYITALPAIIAARRLGIPAIYEVRGLAEITKSSRDNSYKNSNEYATRVKMETETANAADHVFTLTNGMQTELVRRGVPENKITLLPNSCDTDRFVPKARDERLAKRLGINPNVPVIGYIGTIVDYEGLDDLVSACGLLRKKGLEFRLMIVGSEDATGTFTTPITSKLKKSAKSNGIDNWLILTGRVPHLNVEAYYSLIDIAPFPRKPWPVCEIVSPMKPLEALAMEKAVVVSSVQALKDIICDNDTGLVFEKGNVESLASVLQRLLEYDALRSDLGSSGRKFIQTNRSWKNTASKAITVLDRVIKRRNVQNNRDISYADIRTSDT